MTEPVTFKKIYLDPENKTFAEIMGNDKSYTIPPFQRDYAWKNEQLDELWQDIDNMLAQETQHFMGYLVLQSEDGKNFQVIDGQQRLTTVTLMIVAALSRFRQLIADNQEPEDNQKRREHYHQTYLGVFDALALQTSHKLSLNRNNHDHFSDIISEPYQVPRKRNITATNRNLNKALELFQKKLATYNGRQLASFINTLADGLLFTTITVKDDLDAYLVFETLNSRGVHLSASDLLKNYLLSVMANTISPENASFDDFNALWSDILSQLGETNFTAFLRSYHGMFETLSHKKELYRMLKRKITQGDQVMPYIKDIKRHAATYAALQNPDDWFWKEYGDGQYMACTDDLATLKLFNIKTPLSFLMAAYDKFSPEDFVKIIKWVAIISVRYNVICGKVAKDQETTYNKLAIQIMNGNIKTLPSLKEKLMSGSSSVYPNDEEFTSAFAIKSMPSRQSSKKIMYLLGQIEKHCSEGKEISNLTLEHVLPYTPDSAWQEYFGPDTYSEASDRLGNMALLPKSQNMEQESFAQKQGVLKNSGYAINRKIAENDEWKIDTLNAHQQWLAKQAKTVWRID